MSRLIMNGFRNKSFVLVLLLLTSTCFGFIQPPSAEATSARSTGLEVVNVNVLSDYYDRGENMTLSVTSLNLDIETEYSLEYILCKVTEVWNEDTEEMDLECTELFDSVTDSIDIGSGNLFTLTTISVPDPGCCFNSSQSTSTNINNGTMMFNVNITSQNITISSGFSNMFVLGGGVTNSHLDVSNEDVLVDMDYNIHAFWTLEFKNFELLSYTTSCSFMDANGGLSQTESSTWGDYGHVIDPYFSLEASVIGEYRSHCTLTRNTDATVIATEIGPYFEVVEANYTGLEAFSGTTNTDFYVHNDSLTLTVVIDDLFIGTEYELNYNMCDVWSGYDSSIPGYTFHCGSDVKYGLLDDPLTPSVDESAVVNFSGQILFTPVASTHTEQITFTFPGCCGDNKSMFGNDGYLSVDSLENESLAFEINVKAYNVTLASGLSNTFVLGGEVLSDQISYDRNAILIGMSSESRSRWTLDTDNAFTLVYSITCDLVNSTGINVDSETRTWSHNGNPSANMHLLPPSPGDYYSQCSLLRVIDNTILGTQTGSTFVVIDANYTGQEQHSVQTDATFYPHDSTIELSVTTENMYPGTVYTFEYELCKLATKFENQIFKTFCSGSPSFSSQNMTNTLMSGSIDFTPNSASHTEIVSVEIPDCCGEIANEVFWSLENASVSFESLLRIQGVQLDNSDEVSSYFTIGGKIVSSNMKYPSFELLPNMNLIVDMIWELDHRNEFIQFYQEECKFVDADTQTVLDTKTAVWNHRPKQINTPNSIFSPPVEGEYYVECTLTRQVDSTVMGTHTSDTITVLPDLANQDDATMTASTLVKPEGWAMVLVSMTKLDAGQSYSIVWSVYDESTPGSEILLDSGDVTWVEGSDAVEQIILEFNALSDSSNACFAVDLYAAGDELVSLNGTGAQASTLCWAQNSVSDEDSDGVYDKNDQCPGTPVNSVVQTNGCSDKDLDGWDDSVEIACGSDFENPTSVPSDFDGDGDCDAVDTDDDNDGFSDENEILRGTNPFDVNDVPANQLPVCSVYYTLEADGIPAEITGEAAITALVVGTSSYPGAGTGITPVITIPSGNYYVIAVCEDIDNDPVILTVNEVTVGPAVGKVVAGAIVSLSEDVNESVDAVITWNDGTNTATTIITVNMENTPSSSNQTPGFSMVLVIVSLLGAVGFSRRNSSEI